MRTPAPERHRLHGYMLVKGGRYVNLLAPDTFDFAPEMLGHHLALINRFGGATVRPYSVAEHSLLCCDIAIHDLQVSDPAVLLAVLLHDAHEAVLHDITTPQREALRLLSLQADNALELLRDNADRAIYRQYGIQTAAQSGRSVITSCDQIALLTERRDLLEEHATLWPIQERGVRPSVTFNLRERDSFTWEDWRGAFIDRVHELQADISLRQREISSATEQ